VPDDVIVADDALSAGAMQDLIEHYKQMYPDAGEQLARVAPAMVAAHPRAMSTFIEGIRRDYGTFDGYAGAIGVGSAPRFIRTAVLT
jgi:hypothetical protein